MEPDIHAAPRHILFSQRNAGDAQEEIISLDSRSGRAFVISEARCDDDDVELAPVETAVDGIRHTYHVHFACRKSGHHAATMTFVAYYSGDAGPVLARVHAGYFVADHDNTGQGAEK